MLQLNRVVLKRGDRALFDELDVTVHPGHKAGVVGRNGVGKSTMFDLIRGRLLPEEGDVLFPQGWRIAWLEQAAAPSPRPALDYVLDGDRLLRTAEKAIATAEERDDHDAIAHAWSDYGDAGGHDAEARAGKILHGLGFTSADFARRHEEFSGGWRIRLQLARALMTPSDLLLLDEPTNHLDLEATLWLEAWLRRYQGTLLTIAHDREFLDRTVSEIVHIDAGKAATYVGNYASFERQRAETLARQQALHERQQQEIERIHRFVRRFRAKESKARQVQSRLKALDRMDQVAAVHAESGYRFSFTSPRKTSYPTISLDHVALGYDDVPVLEDVTLRVSPDDRIGVLGENGAGKTTLLRCLAREMAPMDGTVTRGRHDSVAYFAQHQLESLDLAKSPLDHLLETMPQQEARDYLGGWGFAGDDVARPARTFSGGEKARLVLALIARTEPAVLVLDEPTNHLDLDMRQALAVALQEYAGALLLVSHDRHMLRQCVDQFWLVRDGRVTRFGDDLAAYEALSQRKRAGDENAGKSEQRVRKGRPVRGHLKSLERRERQLSGEIERATRQLAEVERKLADPAIYRRDPSLIEELARERGRTRRSLERAEESWLAVQEELEATGPA
ncbi:MAG: ATP-binding cassette domain-containing protein [Gammaproteobacteria bacterium]|nr:ATP-binding cassette domain-containing protein [Gammaproteobacteria bacterium]